MNSKWFERARSLHIVDPENLVGSGRPSTEDLAYVMAMYGLVSGRRESDQVWFGASSVETLMKLRQVGGSAGLVWQPGPDGAELALDARLDWDHMAKRFSRVVFGSGDHYFAPIMSYLAGQGLEVVCVAREGSISAASRLASCEVRLLPSPHNRDWVLGGNDAA